jgi:hypothetical protein
MSHVHLVFFLLKESKLNESAEQWILNRLNVRVLMREQHKIVSSMSENVRMFESGVIRTAFYFSYGNFVLGICTKTPF